MPDLDSFLAALSSADPVPGGGSVAALSTAMGAALLVMVANLTAGRKRYADVQDEVAAIRDRAEEIRDRARRLADDDERAYGQVSQALALPRDTDDLRAARSWSVQAALKQAVDPPLATMREASALAHLATKLVVIGNASAISDVAVGSLMADAGYRAARLNVEINLALIRDADYVAAVRSALLALPDPGPWNAEVQQRVEAALGANAF